MASQMYSQLVRYKRWADRGLNHVVAASIDRLKTEDAVILLRLLDHIHVVDGIFQHHLQGLTHRFDAPRSESIPVFQVLSHNIQELDDWYVSYVDDLQEADFDQPIDFTFTSGSPARMGRGEIILHVCLHGAYHRGNAGIILQKSGIDPGPDRMTDFLEQSSAGSHGSIPAL